MVALVAERDTAVADLRAARVEADEVQGTIEDGEAELARLRAGDVGDPRAHLRHVVHPQDPAEIRRSRILDVWSAVSVALGLLLLAVLVLTGTASLWAGLLVIGAAYLAIEAIVRRRFLRLLLDVTMLLAVLSVLILVLQDLALFLAAALLAIGIVILRDNVRELRRSGQ
jgi:hypothetical protein